MTTATLTLTDFLLARIAEDEARFNAEVREKLGEAGPWFHLPRALRECEAKRRIVESAEFAEQTPSIHGDARVYMRAVIARLAAVYADHPDYRDEWRP